MIGKGTWILQQVYHFKNIINLMKKYTSTLLHKRVRLIIVFIFLSSIIWQLKAQTLVVPNKSRRFEYF